MVNWLLRLLHLDLLLLIRLAIQVGSYRLLRLVVIIFVRVIDEGSDLLTQPMICKRSFRFRVKLLLFMLLSFVGTFLLVEFAPRSLLW